MSLPILGFRCWKIALQTAPAGIDSTRLEDEAPIENLQFIGEPYLTSFYDAAGTRPDLRWNRITRALPTSRCQKRQAHAALAIDCTCGLYAYREVSLAVHELRTYYAAQSRGPWTPEYVLGAVVGTGPMLIHELGWRASTARIVAFSDIGAAFSSWPQYHGRQLSVAIGVPVLPHKHLLAYALEHGERFSKTDAGLTLPKSLQT